MKRPSITRLFDQEREVTRFENLLFKRINTATFCAEWGLEWKAFDNDSFTVPVSSLLSNIQQESAARSIMIDSISADIKDFTLFISVKIKGIEYSMNRTL